MSAGKKIEEKNGFVCDVKTTGGIEWMFCGFGGSREEAVGDCRCNRAGGEVN
jgi:hypothetical protein